MPSRWPPRSRSPRSTTNCAQRPTSTKVERNAANAEASRARTAWWRPPQAWDDIDSDPSEATDGPDSIPEESEELLDEIAIERAMHGEPVPLTAAERHEAVARLTASGRSAQRTAELLHMSHRAVGRLRGLSVSAA